MKKYILLLLVLLSLTNPVKSQLAFADTLIKICPTEQNFPILLKASGFYNVEALSIDLYFTPMTILLGGDIYTWYNPILYSDVNQILLFNIIDLGHINISWSSFSPITIPDGVPVIQLDMIYFGGSTALSLSNGFGVISTSMVEPSVLSFTQQPNNSTVYDSDPAQFAVATAFDYDVQYQWQYSTDTGTTWLNVDNEMFCFGDTTPVLTIDPVNYYLSGTLVRCIATGCGLIIYSDPALLTVLAPGTIFTHLRYNSALHQGVSNTTIQLEQNGITMYTITTDVAGEDFLTNVTPGNYDVVVDCQKPWGDVNSVDALEIIKHFVGLSNLTGLVAKASDVDESGAINSTDAMLVLKRFVGMITSFAIDDWLYEPHTINVLPNSQNHLYIDIMCAGDANQSHHIYQ